MHFMDAINPDNLSAGFFTDADMKPIEKTLTIKAVKSESPPQGKKAKAAFYFEETDKKAFLATGEIKAIARTLRKADVTAWIGAKLTMSCAQKMFAGKAVAGMIVTKVNGQEAKK